MPEHLRVLLVDQSADELAALKRSLAGLSEVEVVGDAGFGPVALTWARTLQPDVVVVSTEEPLVRPLATIQTLAQGTPTWTVVALVPRFEPEVVRKVVMAGARDVLVRTTMPEALAEALVAARRADLARSSPASDSGVPAGTIIGLIGVKGGIGKTTLATNLAVSLAQETASSVVLVDLDLPFGDVALMFDLRPETDVYAALDPSILGDPDRLQAQLVQGPSGVHVLTAPMVPDGKTINGPQIAQLLTRLAALHDFVVVDTPPGVNETTAAVLDAATMAFLISTPEVPCLRRTRACIDLLSRLDYPMDKVQLLLNRAESKTRVKESEAEAVLGHPISWRVANDWAAMNSAAYGKPVMVSDPDTALAKSVRIIARQLGGVGTRPKDTARGWRGLLPRGAAFRNAQSTA